MLKGFAGSSMGKESTCNAGDSGDMVSFPGLRRSPGGGHGTPLQYSCLEDPMDRQSSLTGYSPWGHKEMNTTEVFEHARTQNA